MNFLNTLKSGAVPVLAVGTLGIGVIHWGGIARGSPASPSAPAVSPYETPSVRAEGRVAAYPDSEVVIASETGGRIVKFPVREKTAIRRGDLLVEIDASEERAALSEAKARLAEASTDAKFYRQELTRTRELVKSRTIPESSLDRAERDYGSATAREATARATIERLEAVIAKREIRSPIDGVVTSRDADIGETVPAGAALLTVADLKRIRVEAEIDEFDSGRVQLGGKVTVRAEGFPEQSWQGKIEEIPDTVVGRRLKPQDPGKPSDTRVLIVKIALLEPVPVKLGQRVEVEIGGQDFRTARSR